MGRGDLNASQVAKGGAQRGSASTDRDLETAIIRVLTNKLGIDERAVQDLQVLAGLRYQPGDTKRPREAVRRGDLSVIGRMQEMEAKEASGTVTVADFNALRQDVRRLFEVMALIARAVQSV